MDENKVIRPMDFVRLTNIDELNVIKDTKNHIGLVKEVRRVLGENANKDIYRNMKIKATKYRNDYRVWLDYAGDYRNENIE